ncbi:MAG: hypothetical protein RL569_128 [Actinomycetota bacterium]|jgi:GNAT superfamily N-acetyltransferase
MFPGSIEIIPFSREVSRDEFACGNSTLDFWLKQYAGQNEDKFRTRTFLAVHSTSLQLLGYYTTVFGVVEPGAELEGIAVSNYSKPAFLIAKLAVDQRAQRHGVGKRMLSHALNKALEASDSAGLEIVLVDAIDTNAVSFYGRFGFIRFDPQSHRMFMTMKFLRNSSQS